MNIGIFTTIKVKNGIPLFFEHHQKRLISHSKKLQLDIPYFSFKDVQHFLQKNNLSDCALKIIMTTRKGQPEMTLQTRPLPYPNENIKLITVADTRDKYKTIKTLDRHAHEEAQKLAKKQDTDDALFVQNNNLIESTISNIFSVNKNGDIITPPLVGRGLEGIAKKIIILQTPVIEEEINESSTGPIVLTNSLRIQKATELNGKKLEDAEELYQKIKTFIENAEEDYLQKRGGTVGRAPDRAHEHDAKSTTGRRPGQDPDYED